MPTAGLYARISSDPRGEGLGVERQIADCEALARSLRWAVHDTYVDNDLSAWLGKARPEYQRLCEDIKAAALSDACQANAEHAHLAEQVTEDEAMLDRLAQDYAAKAISHREWLSARQPIQARIDAAKRRLTRISPTHRIEDYAGRSSLLRDAWADLPLTRQQARKWPAGSSSPSPTRASRSL